MKKCRLILISTMLFIAGCKKDDNNTTAEFDPLIKKAKDYFQQTANESFLLNATGNSQLSSRFPSSRTVVWSKAVTRQLGATAVVIVPIVYGQPFYMGTNNDRQRLYASNEITRLLVYADKNKVYHAEQVSYFPDSNFTGTVSFSGLISVDDWVGNALNKYRIEKSGRISKWNGKYPVDSISRVTTNSIMDNVTYTLESCYQIYGVNYAADQPEKLYPWVEVVGCTYQVVSNGYDDVGSSGTLSGSLYASGASAAASGSGGAITPVKMPMVVSGTNVIGNIKDYDKCFTNIAGNGNKYSVTVCVAQPVPGKRTAWGVMGTGSAAAGTPINVGHVFLILTQIAGSSAITRNVGFYPEGSVDPLSPSSPGQMNNDASHGYNISLSVTVTNSQFFNILNYIDQASANLYNLNSFNCTSFTIAALNAAGIVLPSTIGTWPDGSGNDPGDFGEDIRTMALGAGMTRSTTSAAHPNLGTCN